MTARLLLGDVFDRMAELPDDSVDLVLTSPPFLALRSYLPADHPDKAKEIGSEPTPAAFLDTLLALTAEWRRVLAPHGSICVELGDTYAGDDRRSYETVDAKTPHRSAVGRPASTRANVGAGWPLAKSLCGIPHLYHLSLAYGRNLLTGQESPAGQWRVRNVVAWCRPNPPVGALGDKFRPGTSYMTVACVSGQRYFDLDAVRQPLTEPDRVFHARKAFAADAVLVDGGGNARSGASKGYRDGMEQNPAGAPPLDWWEIPTQPFAGSHYATWPAALCTRPILAMCPQKVCTTCGEPSRRVVGEAEYVDRLGRVAKHEDLPTLHHGGGHEKGKRNVSWSETRTQPTLGWSDCGHDTWRTGLVLDPFAGSGTTLAVATGHGRDAIGIDLDARNADLCSQRVGMFLEIDEQMTPVP